MKNTHDDGGVKYYGTIHINDVGGDDGRVFLSFDAIPASVYEAMSAIISNSREINFLMSRQDLRHSQFIAFERFFKKISGCFNYFIFDVDLADCAFQLSELQDGEVYEFTIADSGVAGNFPALQYLLGPIGGGQPTLYLISNVSPCKLPVAKMFDFIVRAIVYYGLARYPIYELSYLRDKKPFAVAVYDVGQANMNAVVDFYGVPIIFYDFGKPLSIFKETLPKLPNFTPGKIPNKVPVVISHLDFDHWSFVLEDFRYAQWNKKRNAWVSVPIYSRNGLDRSWVLRAPDVLGHKLGGSQIHFLLQLMLNSVTGPSRGLYFSGINGAPSFLWFCLVHASAGWKKGASHKFKLNNESLALVVYGDNGEKVLLAGDAEYNSLPGYCKNDLTGVVAPHHGGDITPGSVPYSKGGYPSLLIQSVSAPSYGMPSCSIDKESISKGWYISRTDQRKFCRQNPFSTQCHQGHQLIPLDWRSVFPTGAFGCASCMCL